MLRAPLFLSLFLAFPAFATLSLSIVPPRTMTDDLRAKWRVIATNRGHAAVEDFPLLMWTEVSIVDMPEGICTPEGSGRINARCVFDLPAGRSRELTFTTKYTRRSGLSMGQVLGGPRNDLYENERAVFGREYRVTSNGDEGPGSLRQAILDVNRDCTSSLEPCVIAFDRIMEIGPRTALPAITAPAVLVDGDSRVTIDGSATTAGHGLLLEGAFARVTGLTIRRFRGNGIEANGFSSIIRDNDLRENGLRGVQVNGGESQVFDNTLIRNLRAGGFFWTSNEVRARRNVVTQNGASGLFFHKPAVSRIGSFAEDNVISFNAHAGLALSLTADGSFARNTFHDNLGAPIDVGLDGDTRETRDGLPTQGGRVGAPILTSARFDGTATIITGVLARRVGTRGAVLIHESVALYAGARPDTQDEVIAVVTEGPPELFPNGTFTARITRDLRGRWIHAASVAMHWYNLDDISRAVSELSTPLPVE
jgi:hypothetical protein